MVLFCRMDRLREGDLQYFAIRWFFTYLRDSTQHRTQGGQEEGITGHFWQRWHPHLFPHHVVPLGPETHLKVSKISCRETLPWAVRDMAFGISDFWCIEPYTSAVCTKGDMRRLIRCLLTRERGLIVFTSLRVCYLCCCSHTDFLIFLNKVYHMSLSFYVEKVYKSIAFFVKDLFSHWEIHLWWT